MRKKILILGITLMLSLSSVCSVSASTLLPTNSNAFPTIPGTNNNNNSNNGSVGNLAPGVNNKTDKDKTTVEKVSESNANNKDSGGGNTTQIKSEEFKKALKKFLEKDPTEDDIYNWSLAITTLKTEKLPNEAIAGILGNVKKEGGTNAYAIEGYGGKKTKDGKTYTQFTAGKSYEYSEKPALYTNGNGQTMGGCGHGLVQWSFGRADNLTKFAEKHKDFGYVTVKHWVKTYTTSFNQKEFKIPAMPGQVAFMVQELNKDYKSVKKTLLKTKDARKAALVFHDNYEKSADGDDGLAKRQDFAELALPVVEYCGEVKAKSSGTNSSQQIADALVQEGVWGEEQFVKFKSLTEDVLEMPDVSNLTDDELKGIVDWKNNIEYTDKDKGIHFLRVAVMLLGIILLVWVILVYMSYWLDRINNFIDIEFLPMITFGKLRISPEENSCTFDPKYNSRGTPQTVNHRTMLFICLIGIGVSVFIISGQLYVVLNDLIRFILNKLGVM